MIIRDEQVTDIDLISRLTTEAFKTAPHTQHNEAAIIAALRSGGVLSVSLVAKEASEIIGHIAFSPVSIANQDKGWYGLGPVAVLPQHQGRGIGSALIRAGIERLKSIGANGCVLLGEPEYYHRFGFRRCDELILTGVSADYFMALPFLNTIPTGVVRYHEAFNVT
ncbi:N-acetyltransferase [Asticcacaulis sp. ZE23SCel15]|uniref:GNAT family N-acetyltransferase n=1 Tax=Asticcacaulis sp. ZE23SCel15 TaxID=3059027 RepID=UPI00265F759B|nr:N-acetyltransferase [Asticcacaulis sp. ZE23SCel15]WKL56303.1 N-acetyltransferase [Asticcacaulis sp. ZE23SCel15]